MIFLAPIQAIEMCNAGRPDSVDTTSLLELLCGGGNLQLKHIIQLRDLLPGTNVTQVYGQTEIAGAITIFNSSKRKDVLLSYYKPESCGRPIRGIWYKVLLIINIFLLFLILLLFVDSRSRNRTSSNFQ